MKTGFSLDDCASAPSDQKDVCRSGLNGFRKLNKIGFGTYGDIFMAIHRCGQTFALKKFRFGDHSNGIPRSAIREVRILRELTGHRNIVDCYGILGSAGNEGNRNKGSLYLVLGFVDHDLVGILELWKRKLSVQEVKCITLQTLRAVDFCHFKGIVHRDLKCANLLITNGGVVKLADFGLAREFGPDPSVACKQSSQSLPKLNLTNKVITLWYRPPELLLGATEYGPEVDMWSMGAIIAELLMQRPLFSAEKELQVLRAIFDELPNGLTNEAQAHLSLLPLWKEFAPLVPNEQVTRKSKTESTLCLNTGYASWDLISNLLAFEPGKRYSAAAAIDHSFFNEVPEACEPSAIRLPRDGEFCHGMAMKEKRDQKHRMSGAGDDPSKRPRIA